MGAREPPQSPERRSPRSSPGIGRPRLGCWRIVVVIGFPVYPFSPRTRFNWKRQNQVTATSMVRVSTPSGSLSPQASFLHPTQWGDHTKHMLHHSISFRTRIILARMTLTIKLDKSLIRFLQANTASRPIVTESASAASVASLHILRNQSETSCVKQKGHRLLSQRRETPVLPQQPRSAKLAPGNTHLANIGHKHDMSWFCCSAILQLCGRNCRRTLNQ